MREKFRLFFLFFFFCAAFGAASLHAQQVPTSKMQMDLSFSPIVKETSPAVVNVFATRVVQARVSPFRNDPFFSQFFGRNFGQSFSQERMQSSLGSGVLVDETGIVITNYHVIADADQVKVALADKREFEADILLKDERTDLAVLRLENPKNIKFSMIELGDSNTGEVGDLVLAIGNPFGVGQTVTSGIISALSRTEVGVGDFRSFIQTDAAINPGNSGGALINMRGELIGINSAIFTRSGGSNGIGFAVPSNMVKLVLSAARSGQKTVLRPWLGAEFQTVNAELAEQLNLERPRGAIIVDLTRGSPFSEAGLAPGDLILSIDGLEVEDAERLRYLYALAPIGSVVSLQVYNGRVTKDVKIHIMAPPETRPRNKTTLTGNGLFAGLTVSTVSPLVAEELGLDATQGVVIEELDPGAPIQYVGLRQKDVILKVNGQDVLTVEDLIKMGEAGANRWNILLQRGKSKLDVNFYSR